MYANLPWGHSTGTLYCMVYVLLLWYYLMCLNDSKLTVCVNILWLLSFQSQPTATTCDTSFVTEEEIWLRVQNQMLTSTWNCSNTNVICHKKIYSDFSSLLLEQLDLQMQHSMCMSSFSMEEAAVLTNFMTTLNYWQMLLWRSCQVVQCEGRGQ